MLFGVTLARLGHVRLLASRDSARVPSSACVALIVQRCRRCGAWNEIGIVKA